MKFLNRFMALSLVLVLVLSWAGATYAQDDFCLGLSDDDCELYYDLSGNAELPESTAFDMVVDVEADADGEEIAFAFDVSGAYVLDVDAIEDAVDEFNETPVLEVSASTFLDLMRGTVSGFDAELEIDYAFPPEMGVPPLGPFNLWLVDGIGYVDLSPAAMFDPSLEGIYGVDLFDLIEVPLENVLIGDLFEGLDGMTGGDFSMDGGDDNPFNNTMAGFNAGADLSEEDIASFFSIERADDDTVNGTDVVVFVSTLDFGAVMAVDAIAEVAYESAVQSGLPSDISQEDFVDAIAESFDGSVVTVTEKFDESTGYGIQTMVVADITLDIEPLAELTGDSDEGVVTALTTIEFTRSDINAVDAIEVPEDAQVIPVEALFGQ